MTCLVSYDIENEENRRSLLRFLECSGKRVTRSLYAITMQRRNFKKLRDELEKHADVHDKIVLFRLCNGCERSSRVLTEMPIKFIVV